MKYLGVLVSDAAFLIVQNPKHLFAYVDMAAVVNMPIKDSVTYLNSLTTQVRNTFHSSLNLAYHNTEQEILEDGPDQDQEFFIVVSVEPYGFHSRRVN